MVGKMSIQTLEGCQKAVGFVRSIIPAGPETTVGLEDTSNFPKGCYAYVNKESPANGKMYFNTHFAGNRESKSREVCIAEGM